MAAGLGENYCPLELGAPRCHESAIRQALSDDYSPVFDMSDGTAAAIEAEAEARCIALIYAASERMANQGQALKMIEALPQAEEDHGMRPSPRDSAKARRAALAGKFRGYVGNAEPDIRDVCSTILGSAFIALRHVPEAQQVAYWPGMNPGPPGFEWSSNRSLVLIETTRAGLSLEEYRSRVAKMVDVVDDILAGECAFDWFRHDTDGSESGFFLDVSNLDEVGL